MKHSTHIRMFKLLGISLSLTLFFSSYSISQKDDSKKTPIVTIDAKTGESTLHKETNYVSKGESLQIQVNNYNPMVDSIVFNKSERDIDINGGEFTDFLTKYQKENLKNEKSNNQELNQVESALTPLKSLGKGRSEYEEKKLKSLEFKQKVLHQIELTLMESQKILDNLFIISTQEELNQLVEEMNQLYIDFSPVINSIIQDEGIEIDDELLDKIQNTKLQLAETTQFINSVSFKKSYSFQPKKEETEIEVHVYKKSTKQLVDSYNYTFITKNHFKMSGSVGAHVIITDGAFNKAFKNVDSLIVSRRISNIQPSFGTYMNGTWRVNDALVGFGLGLGVPVDGQDNLSPNFSVFFTSLFQTEYGRFGFNVGAAIRQTRILAPGYELRSNLGNASIDVPTISTWKPGLMFGVSYVIGGKEKE